MASPKNRESDDEEIFGSHDFAKEYAVLELILQGFNATTIARKLKEEHPELRDKNEGRLSAAAILVCLQRAIAQGVVQVRKPRLSGMERTLADLYAQKFKRVVNFYVSDDSIGFKGARSTSSYFWSLAAEAIHTCIASLLKGEKSQAAEEIIVGNTGGFSASEAIKALSSSTLNPHYLDNIHHRLCFLSLTAVGSSEHFDLHANYLAALLGNIYGGHHMAVLGHNPSDRSGVEYENRLKKMRMIIGGVGAQSGYLRRWFDNNKVEQPKEMAGDLFFHPIDKSGHLINLSAKTRAALGPLQLQPDREGLLDFFNQGDRHCSLVIVTEPIVNERQVDKSSILDAVLRRGYVTDCVLGSNLAERLQELHKSNDEEKKEPAAAGRTLLRRPVERKQ